MQSILYGEAEREAKVLQEGQGFPHTSASWDRTRASSSGRAGRMAQTHSKAQGIPCSWLSWDGTGKGVRVLLGFPDRGTHQQKDDKCPHLPFLPPSAFHLLIMPRSVPRSVFPYLPVSQPRLSLPTKPLSMLFPELCPSQSSCPSPPAFSPVIHFLFATRCQVS